MEALLDTNFLVYRFESRDLEERVERSDTKGFGLSLHPVFSTNSPSFRHLSA